MKCCGTRRTGWSTDQAFDVRYRAAILGAGRARDHESCIKPRFSGVAAPGTARIQGSQRHWTGRSGHGRNVTRLASQVAVRQPGKGGALDMFGRYAAAIRGVDRDPWEGGSQPVHQILVVGTATAHQHAAGAHRLRRLLERERNTLRRQFCERRLDIGRRTLAPGQRAFQPREVKQFPARALGRRP